MSSVLTGNIYGTDFHFHPGKLTIEDGRISLIELSEEIPHRGPYIIPGLVDIHFHGCMDMDVCDGTQEAIRTIAAYEVSRGITAICPATLSLPVEEL